MNITNFYQLNANKTNFSFNFKAKTPKISKLNELTTDVVEISKPKRGRPKHVIPLKIELTSLEEEFLNITSTLRNLYWKVNLCENIIKDFPSDAFESREEKKLLMKEIRKIEKKQSKITEQILKTSSEYPDSATKYDVEQTLKQKKMYNSFVQKILATTTKDELKDLINRISFIFENAKSNFQLDSKTKYDLNETQFKDLMKLIQQRIKEIKTN